MSFNVGYEYPDPENECYKYVCSTQEWATPVWQRTLDDHRCCKYNSTIIPIGKSIRSASTENEYNVISKDGRCSEKLVSCSPAEHGQHHPNVVVHEIPHAKCCIYDNKIVQFGESILDAEV